VNDRVKGDGDRHMRGIGCLLTGIELFPGNIQGGGDTPAGWASGLSIDQEIKNHLQQRPETATRFGSLEFGVLVPNKADTWTRMVYAGPNKPVAPIDDPYQMFRKLYGQSRDRPRIGGSSRTMRRWCETSSTNSSTTARPWSTPCRCSSRGSSSRTTRCRRSAACRSSSSSRRWPPTSPA
jgi:hypothetical protein